jgi:hypothetical protein
VKAWRSLVVLALAAAGVLVLVWWDQRRPSTEDAARLREQLVPGFRHEDVHDLTITRGGQVTRITRTGEVWTVTGGIRADEEAVDALLSEIELGRVGRTVGRADAALRAKLGLEPPRVRLQLDGTQLAIGADAPGGVYVLRNEEARVADHHLVEVADRDEWRSRRLTLTNMAQATTLSLGKVKLARSGGGWTVDGVPANAHAVDQLLDAIDSARATRFGPVGPGGEPLVINDRLEARILGNCAARADGAELCFDDLSKLRVDATQLRERRLYPFTADAITAVDLAEGGRTLSLRRERGVWRIVAPLASVGLADDPSVHAWLEQLIKLESEGGPQTLTVRTADATATHKVKDQSLDPLRFRDRRIIDLRPDEIGRIEVTEGGKTFAIVREHHGAQADTFRTDPPSNADDEALAQLVETFAHLRADTFTREPPNPVARRLRANGHDVTLGRDCHAQSGDLTFTLTPADCQALLVKE